MQVCGVRAGLRRVVWQPLSVWSEKMLISDAQPEGCQRFHFLGVLFGNLGYGTEREGTKGRGMRAWVGGGHSVVKERAGAAGRFEEV